MRYNFFMIDYSLDKTAEGGAFCSPLRFSNSCRLIIPCPLAKKMSHCFRKNVLNHCHRKNVLIHCHRMMKTVRNYRMNHLNVNCGMGIHSSVYKRVHHYCSCYDLMGYHRIRILFDVFLTEVNKPVGHYSFQHHYFQAQARKQAGLHSLKAEYRWAGHFCRYLQISNQVSDPPLLAYRMAPCLLLSLQAYHMYQE